MKKNEILIILFLISLSPIIAQNYQTVSSDRVAYFDNQHGHVKCIRIDSIDYQNDSILFPFSNILQIDYDCFTPYGASWIGNKLIIQNNGYNIFFNKEHDTVKIKTNASLNESWVAYELADSMSVVATVLKHDALGFLGLLDSTKTIGFQVYDKTMTPITHSLNNMSVLLSENFGLVKTFNFNLFPDYETDYFLYEQLQEYDLIGLSKPQIGIQNLSWFDVHDFQIGDETHVFYESSSWGAGNDYIETKKTVFKYLERTDYSDSIIYSLEIKRSVQKTWTDNSAFDFYHDTIKSVIKPDSLFEKLPGEPIISEHEAYSYKMTNGSNLSKTKPSVYEQIWSSSDSCWSNCCADGCFPSYNYIKGLGGPYYQCDNAFSMGGAERKLVYYRKGEVSWGSPMIITGISNIETAGGINFYPNPAKDHINILVPNHNSSDYFFSIYDIQGSLVMHDRLGKNISRINISDLETGLYMVKFFDSDKVIKLEKILIE